MCMPYPGRTQGTDPIAENMLIYQRPSGGWAKQYGLSLWPIDYSKELTEEQKRFIQQDKTHYEATIDNDATTPEIRYLVKVYKHTGNKAYLAAAERGIVYLLNAQYDNGGWPQFYPLKQGYYTHITYNDNAMLHAMELLQDVATGSAGFDVVDRSLAPRAQKAVDKGIACILRTQVKVNGQLTVWCAQHDEHTLQPAPARAFELVSLSGLESVGLVSFLMRIKDPSPEIKRCIRGAVDWFKRSAIHGYNFVIVKDEKQAARGTDALLVADPQSTLWARFYDIKTNKPIFVGKDGIARGAVSEIENERRVGYAWYGRWPAKLIEEEYPAWLKRTSDETLTDIDGNIYTTVKVGSQTWTAENLRVARYSNGDSISHLTDKDRWAATTAGAYCYYHNLPRMDTLYGKLYNWYAVTDPRGLCPKGWHVPTDKDWKALEEYAGGRDKAGAIKSLRSWDPPNGGATDLNGFGALAGGLCNFYGSYNAIGTFGYYWTSSSTGMGTGIFRKLTCYNPKLGRDDVFKQTGFSCRCVLDDH